MTWREAHRLAMLEAARLHNALDLNTSQRIDVYKAIDRLDLTLMFRPLRDLCGLYIPAARGGILINSNHPAARQRYTGGHELGHHVFGHRPKPDPTSGENVVPQPTRDPDEMVAEAFAAWFLMPATLVRAQLEMLGLTRPASEDDVYALSLRLGMSYEATLWQLVNLRLIGNPARRRYAGVTPREIKIRAGGPAAVGARADVWRIGEQDDGGILTVRPGDRLVISPPTSDPGSGEWRCDSFPPGIAPLDKHLDADRRTTILDLDSDGPRTLELTLRWEGRQGVRSPIGPTLRLRLRVEPLRLGLYDPDSAHGLTRRAA